MDQLEEFHNQIVKLFPNARRELEIEEEFENLFKYH